MEEKMTYISANSLLEDSFRLAKKIWEGGFRPNFIVAIWRGGTPPGIAIHEYFRFKGIDPYHTSIKTQSYEGLKSTGEVEIKGMEHVIEVVNSEDKMLIVDDVFDTGLTIKAVLDEIRSRARKNTPELKVATVYYKPDKNKTDIKPDFYLHENNNWLVFPHELNGLTLDQIKGKRNDVVRIVLDPED